VTKRAKRKASVSRSGPKPFRPSSGQRSDVMLAVAVGMSLEAISDSMGVSRRTLCRAFAHELAVGRAKKMLENIKRLEAAAKAKNVSAIKFLHHVITSHGNSEEEVDQWSAVANRIEAEADSPKSPELRKLN
jgi:hypothetical protein